MGINLGHLLQNPENNWIIFMAMENHFYIPFINLISLLLINGWGVILYLCIQIRMKDYVLVLGYFFISFL